MPETQVASLARVLRRWPAIHHEILELLNAANPGAILDCDLNLALLTETRSESRLLIENLRNKFGAAIEMETAGARATLVAINREIERVMAMIERPESREGRSPLLELAQKMASEFSRLRSISERIEAAQ